VNQDSHDDARKSVALSELPVDELIHYGRRLGLQLSDKMGHGEILRLVRQRQELLIEIDRQALLDIVIWARRPVRESTNKEELAEEIVTIKKMHFADLSLKGLIALAHLRNVPIRDHDPREEIEAKMRACEPLIDAVRRKRREIMGSLISKMISGSSVQESKEYHFLPENSDSPTLKEQITDEGVVSGIARKIRGVADDYVQEKLDEIEVRIDRKLDEIDQRLAEWRDREISNRLKIIKITLLASILVAVISLVYKYIVK
jgi:hypothetical protein